MRLQQDDATLVKTYRPSGLDEEPIGIVAFCVHLEAGAACAAFQDDVASARNRNVLTFKVNGITMKMDLS